MTHPAVQAEIQRTPTPPVFDKFVLVHGANAALNHASMSSWGAPKKVVFLQTSCKARCLAVFYACGIQILSQKTDKEGQLSGRAYDLEGVCAVLTCALACVLIRRPFGRRVCGVSRCASADALIIWQVCMCVQC